MSLFKKRQRLSPRYAIGEPAEKAACRYLQQRGVKLLKKNFHSRFGEIDLIMQDGETLVFIEVRCRQVDAQVGAAESVTFAKMQKIRKTAQYYLLQFDEVPNCRFDVIAMTHNKQDSDYTIEWIKNAF